MFDAMDMPTRRAAEQLIWSAIRLMGSRKKLAAELGISRQVLAYWLNHTQKIPHDKYDALQMLLQQKQLEKAGHPILREDSARVAEKNQAASVHLPLSEKIKLAHAYAKANRLLGKDKKGKPKACPTWDRVRGRTDAFLAQQFHIGSKNKYRFAQKVVASQQGALIEAMDKGVITVYHAYQLTEVAPDVVNPLLALGKQAVIDFLKAKRPVQPKPEGMTASLPVPKTSSLSTETNPPRPAPSTLRVLAVQGPEGTGFYMRAQHFQALLLPCSKTDFCRYLDAFKQCGLIQAEKMGSYPNRL